jgi:hypothetical protein
MNAWYFVPLAIGGGAAVAIYGTLRHLFDRIPK